MKSLNLTALGHVDHLVQPRHFHDINRHSPALSIFTDFKQHEPPVIDGDTPAFRTRHLMRKTHERLKLVVDSGNELIGIISLKELCEQNFMLQQAQGVSRDDILVRDLMVPRTRIMAIDYEELKSATIADLIDTLTQNRRQYCLVLDMGRHEIRGIISAEDIAERLHEPFEVEPSPSFLDMFRAINH